jgi:hypothetical protein
VHDLRDLYLRRGAAKDRDGQEQAGRVTVWNGRGCLCWSCDLRGAAHAHVRIIRRGPRDTK